MIPDVDPDSIAYLNGNYLRLGDARISVLDRGFIFGDGIYEVVPVYGGQPLRLAQHVARLQRSLAKVQIAPGRSDADWQQLFTDMIARSRTPDCTVYLQVTRGVAKRVHGFPQPTPTPTVFAMTSPLMRPDERMRTQGFSVVSMQDMRWLHCDIKSVSLLGNVLAKQYATEHGVDDVIQFRDDRLTEGSSSNVWVVRDGRLLAPPCDHLILEGVRYAFLQELAADNGIPFEARVIRRAEVATADELMLSSATKEILPITRYDGQPVGNGKPGPVYARLRAAYDAVIEQLRPA